MVTLTSSTQHKYHANAIPPLTELQESKGEGESLHDKLAFKKILERARKRIAQKEYYTPEEACEITLQGIREVYAI